MATDYQPHPLLARAREHMESIARTECEIPEWIDEEGATPIIYATPLTLSERRAVQRRAKGDDFARVVETVILKAEDFEGNKIFTRKDKPELMGNGADPKIIVRICESIVDDDTIDPDDYPTGEAERQEQAAKN